MNSLRHPPKARHLPYGSPRAPFPNFLPLSRVNVSSNTTWSTHIDTVSASAIPLILHCSPIIFPGLLNKDLTSIKKSSVVAYTHICKVLISQHFNSCKRLSTSVFNELLNPLHPCLSNALSTSNTRSSFKLLRCRTSLYRNSLIPSLVRHLVNPKKEVDLLSSNLS